MAFYLAIKELMHNRGRFLLIASIVALITTLVLFIAALAEGLGWADFISVHVPKGDRPLIGATEIAQMKPGVILANTARGGVVDEAALAAALAAGHVGGAGVDVFESEPPIHGSPLFAQPTALLSPHIAGLTDEAAVRMAIASIENALAYLDGTIDPALIVNPVHARL